MPLHLKTFFFLFPEMTSLTCTYKIPGKRLSDQYPHNKNKTPEDALALYVRGVKHIFFVGKNLVSP